MGSTQVVKWKVNLTKSERLELKKLVSSGRATARKLMRARILLEADEAKGRPAMQDEEIVKALDVCRGTIFNVRKCYVEEGLEAALIRKPQPSRPEKRILSGDKEAKLIAMACSNPPETVRLQAARNALEDSTKIIDVLEKNWIK
jgi:transposase